MRQTISSQDIRFHQILNLLGIDVSGTTEIVIRAEVGEPVRVEITKWAQIETDELIPETRVFNLVSTEDDV